MIESNRVLFFLLLNCLQFSVSQFTEKEEDMMMKYMMIEFIQGPLSQPWRCFASRSKLKLFPLSTPIQKHVFFKAWFVFLFLSAFVFVLVSYLTHKYIFCFYFCIGSTLIVLSDCFLLFTSLLCKDLSWGNVRYFFFFVFGFL